MLGRFSFGLILLLALAGRVCAQPVDINARLGAWLPDPDTGFTAWSKGQTSVTKEYDYFVCGTAQKPSVGKESFSYAGSACSTLKSGTKFEYGPAGPVKGIAAYDPGHRLVLYSKGCCAWRGFALTAGAGAPPIAVAASDLSLVHTMRGVALGMSEAAVERIYGAARPHEAKRPPGATALSYTTMRGTPAKSPDACGQYQSFTFKQDRLVSIELLAGC